VVQYEQALQPMRYRTVTSVMGVRDKRLK
jgi:hypothetical protein